MKKRLVFISFIIISSGWYSWMKYNQLYECIPSGNSETIQKIIDQGRRYIRLCQGAHFTVTAPLTLKKAGQELSTIGYPTNSADKATIQLTSRDNSLAINAYNVDGAGIKNIRVDGNRRELGQLVSHALVLVGGNISSQEVNNLEVFDSRSWSHIHVNWGDFYRDERGVLHSHCQGVTVKDNIIGPGGEESSGKWSDGISVQCENSVISNNIITDVTDGGIVIFGAPGSTINHNLIQANKSSLLVGIALVDYAYEGSYQGTVVSQNTILSSQFIKTGIAMGPATWDCENRQKFNFGGVVVDNAIDGNVGYGLAVSGVRDWTVMGNIVTGSFVGKYSHGCNNKPNANPGPYLINTASSTGNFQNEFTNGIVETIHTIQH